MPARWLSDKSEIIAGRVLGWLDSVMVLQPDGSIRLTNKVRYERDLMVLTSCFQVDSELTEPEKSRIVREAVHQSKKNGNLSAESVLREVVSATRAIISQPPRIYYLATTVSLRYPSGSQALRRTLHDVSITIGDEHPRKLERAEWFMNGYGDINSREPAKYAALSARVSGKSIFQASEKAFGAIEVLLASINFASLMKRWTYFQTKAAPMGHVQLGPLQVIHSQDGRIVRDNIWYSINHFDCEHPKQLSEVLRGRDVLLSALVKGILHHPLGVVIQKSMRRYQEAVSESDHHVALIRMWAALETLLKIGEKEAEIMRRRIVFLFPKDREYIDAQLRFITEIRNGYVHAGSQISDIFTALQQLRLIYEFVVRFLIFGKYRFRDHGRFLNFLDSTPDLTVLRRQIKTAEQAIRYIRT